MKREDLNCFYKVLDSKAKEICLNLKNKDIPYSMGYFNGHYTKNETGEYEQDYFPIPVISIEGLCEIEMNWDGVSISTKLSRNDSISFHYDDLSQYEFEAYGVIDYLNDFYVKGYTIQQFIQNVEKSNELEIGFSFFFETIHNKELFEFIVFLKERKFYY